MARWQAGAATAVGVAAAAAAFVATTSVGIAGAGPAAERGASIVATRALPTTTVPAVLPPVTEHPVAARPAGARPLRSDRALQVLRLEVIGGNLSLATPEATVELRSADGGRYWTGELPPVQVVDARGTHEGWQVRWDLAATETTGMAGRPLPPGSLRVEGGEPVVVDGTPDGLRAGRGPVLFAARRGSGGGTYETGGTVVLRVPGQTVPASVVVRLSFAVG